jgi:hypothetical protein
VRELLTNMVLIMAVNDVLVAPSAAAAAAAAAAATATVGGSAAAPDVAVNLWDVTWDKIHRFLPGLLEQLFPDPEPAAAPKPPRSGTCRRWNGGLLMDEDLCECACVCMYVEVSGVGLGVCSGYRVGGWDPGQQRTEGGALRRCPRDVSVRAIGTRGMGPAWEE